MTRRNVLLCFDAFGTLFRPVQPVFKQYAEVARKYGVSGFTDDDIAQSFKHAFKEESAINPNYGRATDMGSNKWWTNIIEKTFAPYTDKQLPPVLAAALIHRFSSKEGYELCSDASRLFKQLADTRPGRPFRRMDRREDDDPENRLVVGVITNSDDRVPSILTSFGLRVKPLRHGEDPRPFHPTSDLADVDFAMMSYDVRYEKPDVRIFQAGTTMLKEMLAAEGRKDVDLTKWRKIYVGDEPEKDIVGALDAGWEAVLVDRTPTAEAGAGADHDSITAFKLPDGREARMIQDLTTMGKILEEPVS